MPVGSHCEPTRRDDNFVSALSGRFCTRPPPCVHYLCSMLYNDYSEYRQIIFIIAERDVNGMKTMAVYLNTAGTDLEIKSIIVSNSLSDCIICEILLLNIWPCA